MTLINQSESLLPVLGDPIIWSHCPVCGAKHEGSMPAAYFGDTEDIIFNETCDTCYQWFRMEEFSLLVSSGRSWAPHTHEEVPNG